MKSGQKNTNRDARAKEVRRLVKRYGKLGNGTEAGHTNEWIYKNIIYQRFFISRKTFYNYMNKN